MMLEKNWQEEKNSAYLYELLSQRETDTTRKKLFLELKAAAEKQAAIWEKNWQKEHQTEKKLTYQPDFRTWFVGRLTKIFGTKQLRFILSAMKVRGMSVYSAAPHNHMATAHLETRHKGITSAGNLRAAVFGVNDGLISNVSLLLGIVGANADHNFIVLSGVAGLLAGACSMSAGEYISVRSQREFFEYQISLEKEELELYPEEEAEELASIYCARGVPKDDAKALANRLISDPDRALDTLAREELGLNPADLGSPWGAAIFSFLAFATGAFIPLLPFLLIKERATIFYSIGLTVVALLVIGGLLSLFTNRSAILSGLRMLLIGCIAGTTTYLIGKWIGVALH